MIMAFYRRYWGGGETIQDRWLSVENRMQNSQKTKLYVISNVWQSRYSSNTSQEWEKQKNINKYLAEMCHVKKPTHRREDDIKINPRELTYKDVSWIKGSGWNPVNGGILLWQWWTLVVYLSFRPINGFNTKTVRRFVVSPSPDD